MTGKGDDMTVQDQLDEFRKALNRSIACGDLRLPVVDNNGSMQVVAALDVEPLSTLLGRLRAVGGFANLFVKSEHFVRQVSVIDSTCAVAIPDDDLTSEGDRPGPGATVGMFLDYVEQHPNGVAISAAVGHPSYARDAQQVELV